MSSPQTFFHLPKKIEHYMAVLSKVYGKEGHRDRQGIIVNSQIRIHEEWTSDNWNGGTYGHALYLTVPEALYLNSVSRRTELQNEIKDNLNKLHNIPNEFIAEVFLEMEDVADGDWREASGLLQLSQRVTTPETSQRIWGASGYRVFLSHKAEVKKEVADLKTRLEPFGISAFVAHEDIHPTKKWQDEIEHALVSMDAFVALMTNEFHDSLWTDQEVGFAVGRGIPIIAVKLGLDPYGFIGKFQALSCGWDDVHTKLTKILIKQPRMLDAYIDALPKCESFDQGNILSQVLADIETITASQAGQLVAAYNRNGELRGSFGFNGTRSNSYGLGLAVHLSRVTGHPYMFASSGEIKKTTQ